MGTLFIIIWKVYRLVRDRKKSAIVRLEPAYKRQTFKDICC